MRDRGMGRKVPDMKSGNGRKDKVYEKTVMHGLSILCICPVLVSVALSDSSL